MATEFDLDYCLSGYDPLDKAFSDRNYIAYMFDRTRTMFEYDGLPDTIPAYKLEQYLQFSGVCCITEVDGNLYAFWGEWGGKRDAYYRPASFIVANPWVRDGGFSKELTIGKDCVLCKNDTLYRGLRPMFARYARQLTENDITIRSAQINMRSQILVSAMEGRDLQAANDYFQKLERGEFGAVAEDQFISEIRLQPAVISGSNYIIQLIELQQYIKASWFNEIGLNSNFNMKREALSESEAEMNNDALLPLIDDMFICRQEFVENMNEMYGTNVSVRKSGAWELKEQEVELDVEERKAEVESLSTDSGGDENEENDTRSSDT